MFSEKQKKRLLARARMMKARVHVGLNGVSENVLKVFEQDFKGNCVYPKPSDVVRVKVHNIAFTPENISKVQTAFETAGAEFVGFVGQSLVFYKQPEE